jgi:hypothetical protein
MLRWHDGREHMCELLVYLFLLVLYLCVAAFVRRATSAANMPNLSTSLTAAAQTIFTFATAVGDAPGLQHWTGRKGRYTYTSTPRVGRPCQCLSLSST